MQILFRFAPAPFGHGRIEPCMSVLHFDGYRSRALSIANFETSTGQYVKDALLLDNVLAFLIFADRE